MTFNQIVSTRRSIRSYDPRPVELGLLLQVLEAGRLAPSARNRQDWHFTVVLNPDERKALASACSNESMVREAPAAIAVWCSRDDYMSCKQSAATVDASIALSFMILKATELGLGTCWLGAFDADQAADALGLPEEAVLVAITPLGYPAEQPDPRPRKIAAEVFDIRE